MQLTVMEKAGLFWTYNSPAKLSFMWSVNRPAPHDYDQSLVEQVEDYSE